MFEQSVEPRARVLPCYCNKETDQHNSLRGQVSYLHIPKLKLCPVCLVYPNLRGTSRQRNSLNKISLWVCLSGVISSINWCRSVQSTVSGTIASQVGLDCIIKLARYGPESEPTSSIPLWILVQIPALISLNDVLWRSNVSQTNPSLS